MQNILTTYENYFADVASRHPGLPHITGNARETEFFTVAEPEEIYGELKRRLNTSKFCLLVDKPELSTSSNQARQFHTNMQGGIELIIKRKSTSPTLISAQQNEALNLLAPIEARIRWQHEKRTLPLGFARDSFRTVFLHDKENEVVGARLEFAFFFILPPCQHDAAAWGDV
ncbi:hypothetical protein BWI96_16705 [Siphonobacter sp. SORGH_AS_0500]|uniref:hypothetical protein n=1 Tax=Siphonobacter sp. SORGH_AS_0500 TaxID=1864824 RepID=UPI000CB97124|nr:hypothetical protein [Siphonobacter sp. SORGH_AS_0500]PKK35539.1 hypothetical protein BWI96_16705 [Siphonobacter sp. SORGH_AS_0500]